MGYVSHRGSGIHNASVFATPTLRDQHEENSSGTSHKLLAEFCAFEYFRKTKEALLCLLGYYVRFESTEK